MRIPKRLLSIFKSAIDRSQFARWATVALAVCEPKALSDVRKHLAIASLPGNVKGPRGRWVSGRRGLSHAAAR